MMSVRSADEFYSIMAVLTREMMEFGLMEPNSLIKVRVFLFFGGYPAPYGPSWYGSCQDFLSHITVS